MALFKISKGAESNLPSSKTEGYCYFTTDTQLFYIDYKDSSGTLQRAKLNAGEAESLSGATLSTILESSNIMIPTSKAVLDELAKYQIKLNFDSTPTAGSANPITSGGVKTYTDNAISAHNSNTSAHGDIRELVYSAQSSADAAQGTAENHISSMSNPHGVTAAQVNALPLAGGTMTGALGAPAIGKDYFIAYPADGHLNGEGEQTGYLRITLPTKGSLTMFKLRISIYQYKDNSSVDYIVSAYDGGSLGRPTVYCAAPMGEYSNLPVAFGNDGAKSAFQIGNADTVWSYVKVAISEIITGIADNTAWKSGWDIKVTTEELAQVDGIVINPNSLATVNPAEPVSIEKGGTGATDAATARSNLGITPANIGAAASSHTHSISNVNGLQEALDADIIPITSEVPADYDVWIDPNEDSDIFTHTHDISDVTDLQTTLDTMNASLNSKAATSHKHTATDITSGVLSITRGGTGASSLAELATSLGSLMGGVKIATGSYTGTGTYGSSNPNSLTFDFVPQYVSIFAMISSGKQNDIDSNYSGYLVNTAILTSKLTTSYVYGLGFIGSYNGGNISSGKKSSDGKTIYWYTSGSENYQLNAAGTEYLYFAIGMGDEAEIEEPDSGDSGDTVTTINFTVSHSGGESVGTYTAEAGMTWSEWIASDYNTAGFNISGNYIEDSYMGCVSYVDFDYVSQSDPIQADYAYTTV